MRGGLELKTVAYYRSSIDLQENSIEMQQNSVLTRSIDMALIIDEEYIDEAISARKVSLKKDQLYKNYCKISRITM